MATVHTQYGPGRIVASETVRGQRQFKVAGDGFEVWLDEAKVGGLREDSGEDRPQGWFSDEEPAGAPRLTADELLSGVSWDEDPYGYHNDRPTPGRSDLYRDFSASQHQAWAPFDDDNSTELPYNPDPQHEAVGSPGDDESSTIQPIHHIDADERTHSSDSLSFEEEGDGDEPGPSPHLFARRHEASPAALLAPIAADTLGPLATSLMKGQALGQGAQAVHQLVDEIGDQFDVGPGWGGLVHDASVHEAYGPADYAGNDDVYPPDTPGLSKDPGYPGADDYIDWLKSRNYPEVWQAYDPGIRNQYAEEAGRSPEQMEDLQRMLEDPFFGTRQSSREDDLRLYQDTFGGRPDPLSSAGDAHGPYHEEPEEGTPEWYAGVSKNLSEHLKPWKGASYRPAGLDDRYIDLTAALDPHDPISQFRHDPDAYINRIGHLMDEGLNPRFAEYMDLVEADSGIRTAAWKDVRAKAMRLKTSGKVHVKDIAPTRIMASVEGDHGTYDVLILKTASFGGLSNTGQSHAITNWHCGCEWGKWAFRRKFTFVGRLCSHAYASYLTMQSAHMTGKPRLTRQPKRTTPIDRSKTFPYFKGSVKTADALQGGPERLTPELVVNDSDDAHTFLDVTKDEREDVGPDDVMSDNDIVHFARLMRHCEVTQQPYPRHLVALLARYAAERDDTQSDYQAADADDAKGALSTLRADADQNQEGDFGNMADEVSRIQDAVEQARDNGADASRFVAMMRVADDYTDTANTINKQVPNAVRSDPNSPGGSILWRTPNNQNPEMGSYRDQNGNVTATPPGAAAGGGGAYAQSDRRGVPRPGTDVDPALSQMPARTQPPAGAPASQSPGQATPAGTPAAPAAPASPVPSSAPGGGGYTAPGGGQTTGPVSDGGVAGAENGNNAAITKDQLDSEGYYTVGQGDTLTDIAQRAYGDMNKYQDIAKGNNIANPDVINAGDKIKIENPTGNNGLSGDVTNPAGSTKATTGADTSAITGTGSGNNGGVTTDAASTPPLAAEAPGNVTDTSSTSQQPAAGAGDTSNATPSNSTTEKKSSRIKWAEDQPESAQQPATSTAPRTEPATNPASPSPVGDRTTVSPSKSGDTYDPDQTSPVTGGNLVGGGNLGGFDLGPISDMLGQGAGDLTNTVGRGVGTVSDAAGSVGSVAESVGNIAQGIGGAVGQFLPGIGGAISGIGSGISGLMNAFGGGVGGRQASIFSSQEDFDNWVRYAYPTADGEGKLEPHTHPFAGSGYPGLLEIGSSEEYADKARKKMDDVTDLGDGDLTKSMGKWQRQSSIEELDDEGPYREASLGSTDDDSDIVRTFQAHLGNTALASDAGPGSGRFDDFSGAAQGFLRTAGRHYSLSEQDELIREGDKGGARNLASLDLRNTHYEDMDTLGW